MRDKDARIQSPDSNEPDVLFSRVEEVRVQEAMLAEYLNVYFGAASIAEDKYGFIFRIVKGTIKHPTSEFLTRADGKAE